MLNVEIGILSVAPEYPRIYREIITGDPIKGDTCMEFRLLYSGFLPPSSNGEKRAKEKHDIRRVFHGQLEQLWKVHPNLVKFAQINGMTPGNMVANPRTKSSGESLGLKLSRITGKRTAFDSFPWLRVNFASLAAWTFFSCESAAPATL